MILMAVKNLSENHKVYLAVFGMIAITIIWGSAFVFTKNSLSFIGPFWFLALRFLGGSVVLWLLLAKRLKDINRTAIQAGLVIGLPLWAAYALQTYGLVYTTAGNSAFIAGTYAIFVPLISWLVTRSIHKRQLLLALLTVGFLAVFALDEQQHISGGDWLTLGSAVMYALHILTVDHYKKKVDGILLSTMPITFAGIFHLIFALIFEPTPSLAVLSTPVVWQALLFTAVICTSLSLTVQTFCQKALPATTVSILLVNECLSGAFFGWLLLDEAFPARKLIGAIGLIVCMVGSVLLSKKQTAAATPQPARASSERP